MIKTALLACLLWSTSALAADSPSYDEVMAAARAAFQSEDWTTAARLLDDAQLIRPYSLYVTRNRIVARTLANDAETAIEIAAKAADRGLSLPMMGHPAFEVLAAEPAFASIVARMKENEGPSGEASVVLQHPEADLLPETYAATQDGELEFIGSVRAGTILMRRDGGALQPFASTVGGVYALAVDGETIHAATSGAPPHETKEPERPGAHIKTYSIADGAELASIEFGPDALLGALALLPDAIIATDSRSPRLLIVDKQSGAHEAIVDDGFVNLQGVAYDEARAALYVADYLTGVHKVTLGDKSVGALENEADAHLGGIDGLYSYRGDLIAIQNGSTPQRIVRLVLNPEGTAVEQLVVLHNNLASWREPTNGQIVDGRLRYVATSNWPAYAEDGAVSAEYERQPLLILEANLD